MRFLAKLVLVILALTQLAGCVSGTPALITQTQMPGRAELFKSVVLGSSEKEIIALLGGPQGG